MTSTAFLFYVSLPFLCHSSISRYLNFSCDRGVPRRLPSSVGPDPPSSSGITSGDSLASPPARARPPSRPAGIQWSSEGVQDARFNTRRRRRWIFSAGDYFCMISSPLLSSDARSHHELTLWSRTTNSARGSSERVSERGSVYTTGKYLSRRVHSIPQKELQRKTQSVRRRRRRLRRKASSFFFPTRTTGIVGDAEGGRGHLPIN